MNVAIALLKAKTAADKAAIANGGDWSAYLAWSNDHEYATSLIAKQEAATATIIANQEMQNPDPGGLQLAAMLEKGMSADPQQKAEYEAMVNDQRQWRVKPHKEVCSGVKCDGYRG